MYAQFQRDNIKKWGVGVGVIGIILFMIDSCA